MADKIVLPVRIIMSPTCSSRFFVGRNTRSAAARTNALSSLPQADVGHPERDESVRHSGDGWQQATVVLTLARNVRLTDRLAGCACRPFAVVSWRGFEGLAAEESRGGWGSGVAPPCRSRR